MLTCTKDLTRLTKLMRSAAVTALKPARQDSSALNFDICGFTGVIIVVLNIYVNLNW
jgi:hypothetical protein